MLSLSHSVHSTLYCPSSLQKEMISKYSWRCILRIPADNISHGMQGTPQEPPGWVFWSCLRGVSGARGCIWLLQALEALLEASRRHFLSPSTPQRPVKAAFGLRAPQAASGRHFQLRSGGPPDTGWAATLSQIYRCQQVHSWAILFEWIWGGVNSMIQRTYSFSSELVLCKFDPLR